MLSFYDELFFTKMKLVRFSEWWWGGEETEVSIDTFPCISEKSLYFDWT